jgi:hypothetical protein
MTMAQRGARGVALVAVLSLVLAPFVANRLTPYLFGLPFLLAWIVAGVLLTSIGVGLMYVADSRAARNVPARGDAP